MRLNFASHVMTKNCPCAHMLSPIHPNHVSVSHVSHVSEKRIFCLHLHYNMLDSSGHLRTASFIFITSAHIKSKSSYQPKRNICLYNVNLLGRQHSNMLTLLHVALLTLHTISMRQRENQGMSQQLLPNYMCRGPVLTYAPIASSHARMEPY